MSKVVDGEYGGWVAATFTLLVISVPAAMWLARSAGSSSRDKKQTLPPYAPASILEVVRRLPGETSHGFLEEQAKSLGRYTYRLRLPPGLPPLIVVGDPQLLFIREPKGYSKGSTTSGF